MDIDDIVSEADIIPEHYKKEVALAYAMHEMEKAGLENHVLRIRRFMKCKKFSTMPTDLKILIANTKKKVRKR